MPNEPQHTVTLLCSDAVEERRDSGGREEDR